MNPQGDDAGDWPNVPSSRSNAISPESVLDFHDRQRQPVGDSQDRKTCEQCPLKQVASQLPLLQFHDVKLDLKDVTFDLNHAKRLKHHVLIISADRPWISAQELFKRRFKFDQGQLVEVEQHIVVELDANAVVLGENGEPAHGQTRRP